MVQGLLSTGPTPFSFNSDELEGVALLMTDPPSTSYTSLFKHIYILGEGSSP